VAVAEPRDIRRERIAAAHRVPPTHRYTDWRQLASQGRIADAVVIATQDAMHAEPAVVFAELGYHILLEKPIAPNLDDCTRIVSAVQKAGVLFAAGHVLRYTPYTRLVKSIIDAGEIGDIVSIQHLEPVGFWHYAHSYVRGNWRRQNESAFMLLAKSCHDLDWLQYITGQRIRRVASFGGLRHFTPANKPAGAASRCLDCALEATCPYSAVRLYVGQLRAGAHGWPLSVVVDEPTEETLMVALREGPYGRCVYDCDNDVVDHQVVALEFTDGVSGTFTMTAFTGAGLHRHTRIFGTRGELIGDGEEIHVRDFLSQSIRTTQVPYVGDATAGGGHGGGDAGLMDAFARAVATGDPASILSGPDETLASHLAVFTAETARQRGEVLTVPLP